MISAPAEAIGVDAAFPGGWGPTRWAEDVPGIYAATSLEVPYATANGQAVTAESARALGHDLARAMRELLQAL
jgi:hypothetical protein